MRNGEMPFSANGVYADRGPVWSGEAREAGPHGPPLRVNPLFEKGFSPLRVRVSQASL